MDTQMTAPPSNERIPKAFALPDRLETEVRLRARDGFHRVFAVRAEPIFQGDNGLLNSCHPREYAWFRNDRRDALAAGGRRGRRSVIGFYRLTPHRVTAVRHSVQPGLEPSE
jgi:hypothetical protein